MADQITIPKPLGKKEIKEIFIECLNEFHTKSKPLSYSKKDFAKLIGKSTSWCDEERRKGRMEWRYVGGEVRIPASQIEKYT